MTNVFLISVDALRSDHLGCYGYEKNTTPNIDTFSDHSILYENAYVNGIPTFYSIPSLLTSTYPLDRHPRIDVSNISQYLPLLLQKRNFSTGAFIAENPWLSRHYGYDRGVDKFEDYISKGGGRVWSMLRDFQHALENNEVLREKVGKLVRVLSAYRGSKPMKDAYHVTKDAKEWLRSEKEKSENLFLWIHYMEPHYPWLPKRENLKKFRKSHISRYHLGEIWHKVSSFPNVPTLKDIHQISKKELSIIKDLYDAEINYIDQCFGNFMQFLKEENLYEDSFILLLADHGTEFLDHKGFGHGPHKCYNEVIKVPLIIKLPSLISKNVKENVQFLDIFPSLLSLLEGKRTRRNEKRPFFERRNNIIITECVYDYKPKTRTNQRNKPVMSCVLDKWKLMVNEELGYRELYNLREDPHEETNLIDEKKKVARELSSILTEREKEIRRKRIAHRMGLCRKLGDFK